MSFVIKKGDRKPSFSATLRQSDGGPLDLTDCTVRFIVRASNAPAPKVDAPMIIETPEADGKVRYDWAAGDTDVVGKYSAEIEVTYQDGSKLTIPTSNYIPIQVLADLG